MFVRTWWRDSSANLHGKILKLTALPFGGDAERSEAEGQDAINVYTIRNPLQKDFLLLLCLDVRNQAASRVVEPLHGTGLQVGRHTHKEIVGFKGEVALIVNVG